MSFSNYLILEFLKMRFDISGIDLIFITGLIKIVNI